MLDISGILYRFSEHIVLCDQQFITKKENIHI